MELLLLAVAAFFVLRSKESKNIPGTGTPPVENVEAGRSLDAVGVLCEGATVKDTSGVGKVLLPPSMWLINREISRGSVLVSPSGKLRLTFTDAGNLVLTRDGVEAYRADFFAARMVFESNGQLVMVNEANKVLWTFGPWSNGSLPSKDGGPAATAALDDALGVLAVRASGDGRLLYSIP